MERGKNMTENKEVNYMIVQDGCGACAEAKELFKENIENKKLVVLDITSEKGSELAERNNVESVPTIIQEVGKFQQKCFIGKDGKQFFCDDGTIKEFEINGKG